MEEGIVKSTDNISAKTIQEAEIVFSSNRFYGHVTSDQDAQFVEIRGYKWGKSSKNKCFNQRFVTLLSLAISLLSSPTMYS